jgi:hypothetical protein
VVVVVSVVVEVGFNVVLLLVQPGAGSETKSELTTEAVATMVDW